MGATGRLTGLVLVSMMLAGCSETGFQNWFGAGKYIPDENQVHQGQVLSAPPDLQLHPPGNGQQPVRQAYQAPPPVEAAPPPYQPPAKQGQQPIYEPNQAYQPAPVQPVYQQPKPQPQPQPQPQQVSQAPQQLQPQQLQPQPVQPQVAANDPYAKFGISRYKPDGSKKTQAELDDEMRQKKLEIERAKNPNYGTIFNLGSIWSNG